MAQSSVVKKKRVTKKKPAKKKASSLKAARTDNAAPQKSERRRYRRVPLKMTVKYKSVKRGEISKDWQSASSDFSAGGLSMQCALKLRRGQLMMINLYVPKGRMKIDLKKTADLCNVLSQPAAILSRVAYCKTTGRDRYQLGVEFLDLDKANRKLLKKFLVSSGLLKATSALYGA